MQHELRELLEIVALIIVCVAGVFGLGRWFGWKHNQLVGEITGVGERLDSHVTNNDRAHKDIMGKIEHLETVCNGSNQRR